MSASASTAFLVEHWLFIQLPRKAAASMSPYRGTERAARQGGWMSTLLGPEETGVMSQDIECREALAATSDWASMMAVWIYRLRAGTARILRTV